MTGKRTDDDAFDELLTRVDRAVVAAVAADFDLEAGLAEVRRRAAAARTRAMVPASAGAIGSARKSALVAEAEKLARFMGDGWEDAQVRLGELADQWPSIGDLDPATEDALWQRFVVANDEFRRRHPQRVVVATRPGRASSPGELPGPAEKPVRSGIREAERRLRDGLRAGADAATWDETLGAAGQYCVSIVEAWLLVAYVPQSAKWSAASRTLLGRTWSADDRQKVATVAAAGAIARLRDHVVGRGIGWNVGEGVTLTAELVEGCRLSLPDAMRQVAESHRVRVSGRTASRRADGDPARAAYDLRQAGYSRAEVAEVLVLASAAAVSRLTRSYLGKASS